MTQNLNLQNNQDQLNNFHFLYTSASGTMVRPWCNSTENDYCPLVIAFMSFIIITSIILIFFLCAKTSFKCKKMRHYCRKLFRTRYSQSRHGRRDLNRSTNSQIFNPVTSNISSNSATSITGECNNSNQESSTNIVPTNIFSRIGRRLSFRRSGSSSRNSNVWFTDLSKYPNRNMPPPPPSYDESQQHVSLTGYSHKQRPCYPRKFLSVSAIRRPEQTSAANTTASIVNNAFSMENVCENYNIDHQERSSTVFPSYRCIALTTSPSTRATLSRLGDLSRQLLREQQAEESNDFDIISANIATMASFLDEVPPPYEAVITNVAEPAQTSNRQFNRTRSFMSSLMPSFRSTSNLPNYNSLNNSRVRENLV
jgi:hypothetical protein